MTIRINHLAIVMYKVINNEAKGYLINLSEKGNSVYALHESEARLLLPKYKTEFDKSCSFSFAGAKYGTPSPFHIRTAPALSALKKKNK